MENTDELATLRARVETLEQDALVLMTGKSDLENMLAVVTSRRDSLRKEADALRAENARLRDLLRETRGAWWRDTDLPRELFDDLPLVKQIRITLARTEAENG